MIALETVVALAFIVANFLLLIFFGYTIYAVFRGAVFLPTPKSAVLKMLKLARPTPKDSIIDLGSGDGNILIQCADSQARCVGVEINILLVWLSRMRLALLRKRNVEIWCKDFWSVDLSEFDLVCIWLVPLKMSKLKKKIQQEMKPGSRIVSYRYTFPDWEPTEVIDNVYLYIT